MARGEKIQNPDGDPTGPKMSARWDSECAKGDTIDEGEIIVMYQGEPYHAECALDAGLRVPR